MNDSTPPPQQQPQLENKPQGTSAGMSPNMWAMLTHLSGLIGYLGNGIGSAIGPLVFWLVKKDSMANMDAHGKEALNFNISFLIYGVVLLVVTIVLLIPTLGLFWFVGAGLGSLLALVHIILIIVATLKAADGEVYRYPLTIRFFR